MTIIQKGELMGDLISRQAAIDAVQNRHMMLSKEKTLLINDLEKLPTAEPQRIKGKWALQSDDYHEYYECDQCGIAVGIDDIRNFCPNCGADMRGEQDDSLQGRCSLMGTYPTGGWFCGNARRRKETTNA